MQAAIRFIPFFAVIASMTIGAAYAEDMSKLALGTYELRGSYNQKVKISSSDGGRTFKASFEVYTRGCLGDVTMSGRPNGKNSILFVKQDSNVEGGACKISVKFSSNFKAIDVSHPYCGYSGPSCDFNGKLKKTKI